MRLDGVGDGYHFPGGVFSVFVEFSFDSGGPVRVLESCRDGSGAVVGEIRSMNS